MFSHFVSFIVLWTTNNILNIIQNLSLLYCSFAFWVFEVECNSGAFVIVHGLNPVTGLDIKQTKTSNFLKQKIIHNHTFNEAGRNLFTSIPVDIPDTLTLKIKEFMIHEVIV